MGKYIAREVAPERSTGEYEFDIADECANETMALYGNKEYNSHTCPVFDRVREVCEGFDNGYYIESEFENAHDCVYGLFGEYLEVDHIVKLTEQECAEIMAALNEGYSRYNATRICKILSVLTRTHWDYKTIRGVCQSDWQIMYYNASWSDELIRRFEMAYFNTGTEFEIIDAETNERETFIYCYEYGEKAITDEMKEYIGSDCELKVLWFDGYTQVAKYRETY